MSKKKNEKIVYENDVAYKKLKKMSKEEIDIAYKELQKKKKEKARIEVEEERKKIEEERICSNLELDFLKIIAIIDNMLDSMLESNEKLWYTDVVTQCFNFNCKFSFEKKLTEAKLGYICRDHDIETARYQNRSYIVKSSIIEMIKDMWIVNPCIFKDIKKNFLQQQTQQHNKKHIEIAKRFVKQYMRQIEKEKK
mgnify:CR=1 FL=1